MHSNPTRLPLTALAMSWLALSLQLSAIAQGTTITYQGRLNDGANPANGSYDLTFSLFDAASNGTPLSGPVTNVATAVSNGLFTVTLDFGAAAFTGGDRWLEIGVQTNGGSSFVTLSPRQSLTPAPYAIYSGNATYAGQAGGVVAAAVSAGELNTVGAPTAGQVLGFNGSQLLWQDPVLGGGSGGWSLSGNLGTSPPGNFLGTLDIQALELHVAGARGLRLEPDTTGNNAPNLIGGSGANFVAGGIVGATIAGGGGLNLSNQVTASFGAVGGGVLNLAAGAQAFVGGGFQNHATGYISSIAGGAYNVASSNETFVGGGAYNVAGGYYSTIAGGNNNVATLDYAAVLGGSGNLASGLFSSVLGGDANVASGVDSVSYFVLNGPSVLSLQGAASVGGGYANQASGTASAVPGGIFNVASGDLSLAAGAGARALHAGSFVWADDSSFFNYFSSAAANQFLIRASGGVGIGSNQTPPGGLRVASGGLAVTGASSPNYPGSAGVFIEKASGAGAVFAYDYNALTPLPLALNSPGGLVGVGTLSPQYTLDVNGTTRTHSIIITGGADLAEPFKMGSQQIPEGAVVVIDDANPGALKLSTRAYDHRVAGVVSGAKGIHPGIALQQQGALEGGQNVALSGRVYALADAANGGIEPGDLLTTSATPGHAMKVTEPAQAQGAILGKAMSRLHEGKGLVLVLVTLE